MHEHRSASVHGSTHCDLYGTLAAHPQISFPLCKAPNQHHPLPCPSPTDFRRSAPHHSPTAATSPSTTPDVPFGFPPAAVLSPRTRRPATANPYITKGPYATSSLARPRDPAQHDADVQYAERMDASGVADSARVSGRYSGVHVVAAPGSRREEELRGVLQEEIAKEGERQALLAQVCIKCVLRVWGERGGRAEEGLRGVLQEEIAKEGERQALLAQVCIKVCINCRWCEGRRKRGQEGLLRGVLQEEIVKEGERLALRAQVGAGRRWVAAERQGPDPGVGGNRVLRALDVWGASRGVQCSTALRTTLRTALIHPRSPPRPSHYGSSSC